MSNDNSTINRGKIIETGSAVQLTFDNEGIISYRTIYGDIDSIKQWITDYASKHGGKKVVTGRDLSEKDQPKVNKQADFGYRVPVEYSKFPKNVDEDSMVKKVQKSGKRVDSETITVALVGNDLYLKRAKGKDKSGMEERIPNTECYTIFCQ